MYVCYIMSINRKTSRNLGKKYKCSIMVQICFLMVQRFVLLYFTNFHIKESRQVDVMPFCICCPGRKDLVIGLSVRLSLCRPLSFVRNSVPLTYKVQHLKFGRWYSYQTWTVNSNKDCPKLHDNNMLLGVGRGQNLGRFCHFMTVVAGASVSCS